MTPAEADVLRQLSIDVARIGSAVNDLTDSVDLITRQLRGDEDLETVGLQAQVKSNTRRLDEIEPTIKLVGWALKQVPRLAVLFTGVYLATGGDPALFGQWLGSIFR